MARSRPPSSTGGSSNALPVVAALALAGGGGLAYYMDLIPGLGGKEDKGIVSQAKAGKIENGEAAKGIPAEDKEATPEESATRSEVATGNKVENIELPKGSSKSSPPLAVTEHPVGGHKVLMKPASEHVPTADTALKELQTVLAKESSESLQETCEELSKIPSLNMDDLDSLTITQLKVRLVQLAKEMEDRTKWEAVRLKEFLAMKEKDTAEQ